jgi:Holliday junction resolvase
MTPEGKVKEEIKRGLKALGAYWFMPVQTGYGARTVDILACVGELFVAIEVKSATGRPTANQLAVLEAVRRAGGIAVLARSWKDVEDALSSAKQNDRISRGHGDPRGGNL